MVILSERAQLEASAAQRPGGLHHAIAVAVAWGIAVLAILLFAYLGTVADLALSDMPDEVSTMLAPPAQP